MNRTRLTTAAAAAAIAILTGCATHHTTTTTPAHTATISTRQAATLHLDAALHQTAATRQAAATRTTTPAAPAAAAATDPSVAWLESPGGQAQVTLNTDIDTLAGDLQTEAHAPTVANHLIFEADARTVRTQAQHILAAPALQPTVNRGAYQHMLRQFITLAGLLQPGAGYGTTPQDYTAWYAALAATNINIW